MKVPSGEDGIAKCVARETSGLGTREVLNQLQMLTKSDVHMAEGVKYMDWVSQLVARTGLAASTHMQQQRNCIAAGHEGEDAPDEQGSGRCLPRSQETKNGHLRSQPDLCSPHVSQAIMLGPFDACSLAAVRPLLLFHLWKCLFNSLLWRLLALEPY